MAKVCSKCGRKLEFGEYSYNGECEECHKNKNCMRCNKEIIGGQSHNGYCEECYIELQDYMALQDEENETEYTDFSNSSNIVANKFMLVVAMIKFIGYVGACITAMIFMASMNEFGLGLLSGIVIAIVTWFSTLIFEAIAEALNLLQEIRDK